MQETEQEIKELTFGEKHFKICYELGKVPKNATAQYKFADLESMLSKINPLLETYNCRVYSDIEYLKELDQAWLYTYFACNVTDRVIRAGMPFEKDPNIRNKIQAAGSAITYLRRYTMYMLFSVVTTDDDGNTAWTEEKVEQKKPKKQPVAKNKVSSLDLVNKKVKGLKADQLKKFNLWCLNAFKTTDLNLLKEEQLKRILAL